MLWLLLIMGSATAFSTNYPKVFGDDWTSAAQFVNEHHAAWKPLFEEFGVDARLAEAIIFPELIRYSRWQDEIETAAVNGLYVLQGTSGANFSIGRFQMKPSFAEEVEAAWNQSPLAKEYGFVFNLQDGAEARRSRIRRLDTMEGQCRYLAIFIRLQFLRHPQLQRISILTSLPPATPRGIVMPTSPRPSSVIPSGVEGSRIETKILFYFVMFSLNCIFAAVNK